MGIQNYIWLTKYIPSSKYKLQFKKSNHECCHYSKSMTKYTGSCILKRTQLATLKSNCRIRKADNHRIHQQPWLTELIQASMLGPTDSSLFPGHFPSCTKRHSTSILYIGNTKNYYFNITCFLFFLFHWQHFIALVCSH